MIADALFIDHYDSFSFNVLAWLDSYGISCQRWDHILCEKDPNLVALPKALILSPGPKAPRDYPHVQRWIDFMWGRIPIVGFCLGHQMIAAQLGFACLEASNPMHGALRAVQSTTRAPASWPQEFKVAAYNSLSIDCPGDHPFVIAQSSGGDVEALYGHIGPSFILSWQFHPESSLTPESDHLGEFLSSQLLLK